MTALPSYLTEVLAELSSRGRRLAFVRTDDLGRVLERGGELDWYELDGLEPGDDLCRACVFIEGLIPMTAERLDLPRLSVSGNRYADVHLVQRGEEVLVLLLDASGFVEQQSALVQKGNDLNLLLARMGGRETASGEWTDLVARAGIEGVEREASVLSVHLRPSSGESYRDASILAALDRLTAQVLLRLREGSAVTEVCGTGRIQAVFGVLPSTGVPQRQALAAAEAIHRLVPTAKTSTSSTEARWSLSAGVATGEVVLHTDDAARESRLVILGEALERAWALCSSAAGGRVLVDAATVAKGEPDEGTYRVENGNGADAVYELGAGAVESLLDRTFAAMGAVLLGRQQPGVFRLGSSPPEWLKDIVGPCEQGDELRPGESMPFLDNFLVDAEGFWERGALSPLRSGTWNETSGSSADLNLEALAINLSSVGHVLVIQRLDRSFRERSHLLQRARELSLGYEELFREVQKKEVLLQCIVHDLKSPLTGMIGSLSMLRSDKVAADQVPQLVEMGLRNARRQDEMIHDILDVFSAELDALESHYSDADRAPDLMRCLDETVERVRPAFEQMGARLEVELETRGPVLQVVGEPTRLERVLGNLLDNALRYAPARSTVVLRVRQLADHALVEIEDEGPGVSPRVEPMLFQRFARDPGSGGTGLGLYFCRVTVERWGGRIGYSSREPRGARFWLHLKTLDA